MSVEGLFFIIIAIVICEFCLTKYLGYLNTKNWSDTLPDAAKDIYDQEKYQKSQKYEKAKYSFWQIQSIFSFVIMFGVLVFWGFGFLDSFLRGYIGSPIYLALSFFAVISLLQMIVGLPFSYYSTFVIEQKYGFNKMTKKLFFLDTLKWLALSAILGWAILSLLVWIYSILGSSFWLYGWGIMVGFMLFFMMFYSSLIVPLFNKQTPLEKWELKTAIEKFAQKVGFQLDNIYVIDGSKRSSKANAYFSGIGPKKRIVLFDTLIDDLTTDELVAVLAHEIGHYKKKHTFQMLTFSILQTGLMFYIFSLALWVENISLALWATESSFHIGAVAFGILFTPLSMVLGMFGSVLSRKNEYEADAYAKEFSRASDLIESLKKLSRNNLSNLLPHPAYEFFYYSHPTVLKRVAALQK